MFWGKNTKIHGIAKTNPLLYRSIHSEAKQLLKRANLKKNTGKLRLGLLGKISYSMRGEVVGDDLRISIDSSKGVFGLVGKRTGA